MKSYLNEIYDTKNYGKAIVISEPVNSRLDVRFLQTGTVVNVRLSHLKDGAIKDVMYPRVYGVGIVGNKYPTTVNRRTLPQYELWGSMLSRCYDPKQQLKQPSYIGYGVSENFAYYPFFYEWCNDQIGFGNPGWQLDKDLLFKGNKLYSEYTCVFIPAVINSALTKNNAFRGDLPIGVQRAETPGRFRSLYTLGGRAVKGGTFDTVEEAFMIYKQDKEQYLQHLAYQWESFLDPRAYSALLHYSVDITD